MAEPFQRLFSRNESQVLSMNVQAALGPVRQPGRSQFSWLVRHFLERFFNHETTSPDGDAKARLVQIACAAGLPPFVIAVYLWPVYHPIAGWPPGQPATGAPPPYWLQVNHHLFFVLYSFVAMGIATVFEWDLFFPDLLDLLVLGSLPIAQRRAFAARVTAIAILIAGFLFDANVLAAFVLPMAMDPSNLPRFLAGHLLAAGASGMFAAASILALQGVLLCVLGERLFRTLALLLQGLVITFLVVLMLLFPVLSGAVPVMLQSGSLFARCFPPFWFLGIYQRLLDGPAALPVYTTLARTGCIAMLAVATLAALTYPLAYLRRTRDLVEGYRASRVGSSLLQPLHRLLHFSVVRPPVRRAVFHFISQTLLRVPRYPIYLVLYGGVGLAIVTASILRFTALHKQVSVEVSADGIRVAIAIFAFWLVAGLRMAFVSSGNQRGRWLFRIVHGNPPHLSVASEQLFAAKVWVFLWATIITLGACVAFRAIEPPELLTWSATASQALIAVSLCLLLTDIFFINVMTVAFTGDTSREQPNLAITVLKYFTFFPVVAALPIRLGPWIQSSVRHFVIVMSVAIAAHHLLRHHHRQAIREHCSQLPLEDDEKDFPMKLGLRG